MKIRFLSDCFPTEKDCDGRGRCWWGRAEDYDNLVDPD